MRETLRELAPYRPPEAEGLALHRNTNRLGAHPATRRLAALCAEIDLSEYPDAAADRLREALGKLYGLSRDHFLVGNGSNEVFDLICKTFLNPGDVLLHPSPSYALYRQYARANAARIATCPLDARFQLDPEEVKGNARLIVLCSPNNPTGNAFQREAIERVLARGRLVVIDEAYGEFADQNWLVRVQEFPNLLVVRTLSKAYGLAGLRVGYVAADPELIEKIERARLPYNVNALSQVLATAAVEDQAFVREYVGLIRRERARWTRALSERGFHVWPSDANFLLAAVPKGVERDALIAELARRGVLLRRPPAHPRLDDCVRITVGTPQDLRALTGALHEVLPLS